MTKDRALSEGFSPMLASSFAMQLRHSRKPSRGHDSQQGRKSHELLPALEHHLGCQQQVNGSYPTSVSLHPHTIAGWIAVEPVAAVQGMAGRPYDRRSFPF